MATVTGSQRNKVLVVDTVNTGQGANELYAMNQNVRTSDNVTFNNVTIAGSISGYATESYVGTQISNLVDSSPAALNTLNELAAAIGDDANFSTTVTNSIAAKLPLAGGTLTGDLIINSANAEVNLRSGVAGTSGAINWTFNTNGTDYASIKLPYDTRASTGLHIDSGYPITIDASSSTGIKFVVNTANKATINGSGLTVSGTVTATDGNSTDWNTAHGWGNHASAGYTSNAGDITAVTAGTGMTGGGTSGAVTLNVIGGSGITANANDIAVDSTVIRTTGNQTLAGGLTISGSVDSDATDMGFYQSPGTNLILKGDSVGRSGIFFESEKDGVNINDPSDYGFIQFHAYGYGATTGESADFVIGVSNDSTDHVILQSPYNGGVKVGYKDATSGTGLTTQTIFHDAYHPNADKWTSARNHVVTLTGAVTGTATQSVDGTANETWTVATTATSDPTLTLAGDITGSATFTNLGNASLSASVSGSVLKARGSVNVTTSSGGSNTNPFDDAHTETKVAENGTRAITYTGASATMLTINTGGSASVFQIGAHYNGNDFYMRTRTDSAGWKTWKKLFHDSYHPNADKWTTARTLALTGGVTGSVSWDGSANASMTTTIPNDSINSQHYAAGSIDREHLAADIIDGTKIANDVINSEHYVHNSIDALHLNVSGNGTTSQYLRSDGDGTMSWVTPPDTNTNTTYTAGSGLTLSGTTFKLKGGEIPSGVNLNTYRTTGIYSQNSNSDATAGSNWPVNAAGILEVWNDDYGNGIHCTQRYSQYNATNVFNRNYYNGTWTAWRDLTLDTNTQRAIHDSPVNGATTTSISSNWAFDNVKTAVPTGALFTDTNTQRAIHDSPVNGATTTSISSNWAFDNVKTAVPTGAVFTDTTNFVPLAGGTMTGQLTISGASPQMKFNDTDHDDFWLHVNSNRFYILPDRDSSGGWESPYALELDAGSNIGYVFGQRIFNEAYHPNADKWTTLRTLFLTGDVTGNVNWDGSANATMTTVVANDSHTHSIYVPKAGGEMNGALTIDVDNQAGGALLIEANQTNPEQDFYFAQEIYSTLSGSTVTTSDREQGAIYIDLNSSATGGGTAHEHRVYGIYADVDSTGDADVVTAGYFNATATPTTGQTTNVTGVDAFAEDNGGAGATSNIIGVRGTAWSDNSTSDANLISGGQFKAGNAADSGTITAARGVQAEIELTTGSGDIYGTSYVFDAQYDNNTGAAPTHTAALYYGNYAGTLPTTAYGFYIADIVRNYMGGWISGYLGSISQPTYGFNGDSNTGMYSPANHEIGFSINGTQRLKLDANGATVTGNIAVTGTVDGRDVAADGTKLDGIASGATANTGDITAVTAGTGLTGGATSGAATLNVIGGDGITANADDIAVDSTVVRTSGTQLIGGNKSWTGTLYMADKLGHYGDSNTYMQFHAADQWRVVTGATERLEVNNSYVTVAPTLSVANKIMHTGDTDTYMSFDAADQWKLYCGGYKMIQATEASTGYDYISFGGTDNSGEILFNVNGGDAHFDGNVYAYSTTTSSDRKLKKNIQPLEGALEKVQNLRGVSFEWKKDDKKSIGFIAQEVQEVVPDLVKLNRKEHDGVLVSEHLGVDYGNITALLVEAMKEQQETINKLEARILALEKGEK